MNKTREDATDFISSKLSIRTQYNAKYDLTDYYVEYNGGGFWLVIDDLKGYYDFSNGVSYLNFLFKSDEQKLSMIDRRKKSLVLVVAVV